MRVLHGISSSHTIMSAMIYPILESCKEYPTRLTENGDRLQLDNDHEQES